MPDCPHCGKEYSSKGLGTHVWRAHGLGKDWKPNTSGLKRGDNSWSKGLTKDTDMRLRAVSESMKANPSVNGRASTPEKELARISKIKANSGNIGGYRQGSGRGKQGWYKGFWCDSSWELAFVIYCLDNDIAIERNKRKFAYTYEGKRRHYIPDFKYPGGAYVEVKGYMNDIAKAKISQFKDELVVLGKDEMQPILEYVLSNYGVNFIELYENGGLP